MVVRPQISSLVYHIIGNIRVSLDLRYQCGQKVWRQEEFQIGLMKMRQNPALCTRDMTHLLIYITVGWTPPVNFVVASRAVYRWLRIDSEESELVQVGQVLSNNRGF